MKMGVLAVSLLLVGTFLPCRSVAQEQEIAQLVLNIEKLAQFRKILQNMYDGYQVLTNGYNTVRDVASGNYKLHQIFLDGLYAVSPEVRRYWKIAEIVQMQVQLLEERRKALRGFQNAAVFSSQNLELIAGTFNAIVRQSGDDLDELLMIITAGSTRMSDAERLAAIDRIHGSIKGKLVALRRFTVETQLLAVQREREKTELQHLRRLQGL